MANFYSGVDTLARRYFFFTDAQPTEIYTLSLHDALPIWRAAPLRRSGGLTTRWVVEGSTWLVRRCSMRSEEHTSELQSLRHLVCRLLLEKKKENGYARLLATDPDSPISVLIPGA